MKTLIENPRSEFTVDAIVYECEDNSLPDTIMLVDNKNNIMVVQPDTLNALMVKVNKHLNRSK